MIKDIFDSFKDNLKERTTNPFLGTFVIVWVVKNWKLVYSLLYFDGSFKLHQRLSYITQYFNDHSFIENIFSTSFYTLIVLLVTYLLLSVSRLLVNFFEKIVTPQLYKLTDKGSVVLKTEHEELKRVILSLETRLEEERQAKVKAQDERDKLEQRILEKGGSINDIKPNYESDFYSLRTRIKGIDPQADLTFAALIDNIYNRRFISKGSPLNNLLLVEDIIELQTSSGEQALFNFTSKGKEFVKFWNKKEIA